MNLSCGRMKIMKQSLISGSFWLPLYHYKYSASIFQMHLTKARNSGSDPPRSHTGVPPAEYENLKRLPSRTLHKNHKGSISDFTRPLVTTVIWSSFPGILPIFPLLPWAFLETPRLPANEASGSPSHETCQFGCEKWVTLWHWHSSIWLLKDHFTASGRITWHQIWATCFFRTNTYFSILQVEADTWFWLVSMILRCFKISSHAIRLPMAHGPWNPPIHSSVAMVKGRRCGAVSVTPPGSVVTFLTLHLTIRSIKLDLQHRILFKPTFMAMTL